MTVFLELAKKHYPHKTNDVSHPEYRDLVLKEIATFFDTKPDINDYLYEFILLLLSMKVTDRIYVQRALYPLAKKHNNVDYMMTFTRALQQTDAWVDINAITDNERRPLPNKGLEISPEYKLP